MFGMDKRLNLEGSLLSIRNKTTTPGFLNRTEVKYIYKDSTGINNILFECRLQELMRSKILNDITVVDYEIGYSTGKPFKTLSIILQLDSRENIDDLIAKFKLVKQEIEESNAKD